MTEQDLTTTALAKRDKPLAIISNYMRSSEVMKNFGEVIGIANAPIYISTVLLAVANSDKLKECTPQSIYTAAIQIATLRLSLDPNLGQAYLVPFKSKATVIVGYMGLVQLAIRTNQYRHLNVAEIYEGEHLEEDRITGRYKIAGQAISDNIIEYLGFYELYNGFTQYFRMSVDQIHEHAKRYSKNYNYDDSLWKKEPRKMEKKTVLRLLLRKKGYINPFETSILNRIEQEEWQEVNKEEEVEVLPQQMEDILTPPPVPPLPEVVEETPEQKEEKHEQYQNELGFPPKRKTREQAQEAPPPPPEPEPTPPAEQPAPPEEYSPEWQKIYDAVIDIGGTKEQAERYADQGRMP